MCGTSRGPFGHRSLDASGRIHATTFHYCRACDLIFRRVPPEVMSARFEGAGYTAPNNRVRLGRRREGFFQFLLDLVERGLDRNRGSLLDVGASYGHLLRAAKDRGFEGQGVEIVDRLRRAIEADLGVRCWSDLHDVQGEFDVVTFVDSFYYFYEPHDAARTVARLLRPGGLVVFRVMNRNLLVRALSALGSTKGLELVGDGVVSWSMTGMKRLLPAHSMEIEQIRFYERGWKRPVRTWLSYGPAVAASQLTRLVNQPVAPGLIVVARKMS